MRKWFEIKAAADVKAAAEIYLYGRIGEDIFEESVAAIDFVRALNDLKNEEITIRINSVGGSLPDSIAIYNAIQRHPSTVKIAIDGMAMSGASLIAMAGPSEMAENALLMIHGPATLAMGFADEIRDAADQLDRWAEAMAQSYASKSGQPVADIMALLTDRRDHYYTASEAQAAGFVDTVVESMPIAASHRFRADLLDKFKQPPVSVDPFVIHAASAAAVEEPTMDRKDQIRAKFKAHAGKPGVDELLAKCLEDESVTAESAEAKLQDVLAAAPPPAALSDKEKARLQREGAEQESRRRNDIQSRFKPFASTQGVEAVLEKCLTDTTITPESAGERLLKHLGDQSEPVAGDFHVRENPEREKFQEGVVASILARAGKADADTRTMAKQSGFLNCSLMELAKASLSRAHIDFSAMAAPQIAQAAITQTTSDFPILLENAMHKALLDAYRGAGDTWSRFCRTGSVSDFRAHGRYRTGSIGNYLTVNEAGDYENVAIPDGQKQTITAADRGLIINLTYQAIVNDDLGSFIGLASDAGRAGRRTIEAAVYALLAENSGLGPDMADTNPLFDASHNNLGTGAALSAASIEADRVVMGSQTDVSGNEFLDLRPAVWVGPLSSGGTARTINDAQYSPDAGAALQEPNVVRGLFTDIVDTARLTGTRYYLFANPADAPVIEVAFLNGEQEPMIVMEESFSSRGARWRATLDFGVAPIDFRGAVTNAGTT